MSTLDEKTTVPLFAGLRGVWTIVAFLVATVGGALAMREDVLSKIQSGNATTAASLGGIDAKITGLAHRMDLFEQKINAGVDDRWRKADMRLWVWKARQAYKDLPDVE